jgi:hypothetical protein
MAASNEIEIAKLRIVLNKILDFVEHDLHREKVDLNRDHYWEVPHNQLYETVEPMLPFNCGSLENDWRFLLSALTQESQAIPIMLVHAAPILAALAFAVPSYIDAGKGRSE